MSFSRHPIVSTILGTTLEFYDSSLVLVYAPLLGQIFFQQTNTYLLTIYRSLGIVVLGILVRPLGGLLFGYIGDRYGRKQALSLSMIMMAIPSLTVTLLPSYESIGNLAPFTLFFVRIIQGLCTGGEYKA